MYLSIALSNQYTSRQHLIIEMEELLLQPGITINRIPSSITAFKYGKSWILAKAMGPLRDGNAASSSSRRSFTFWGLLTSWNLTSVAAVPVVSLPATLRKSQKVEKNGKYQVNLHEKAISSGTLCSGNATGSAWWASIMICTISFFTGPASAYRLAMMFFSR